jgi:dihydrofolate reductase
MTTPPLTLIVAATRANGIGQAGALPWRLPQEMAYFARVTAAAPAGRANAVLMGRKTWESIPRKFRPLRRRVNAVVSRDAAYTLFVPPLLASLRLLMHCCSEQAEGAPATVHASVADALVHIASVRPEIHRTFLMGGANLYNACLRVPTNAPGHVARVLLTRVLAPAFEGCDVFLDDFAGAGGWARAPHAELVAWVGGDVPDGEQEEGGVRYEFQMWVRTDGRDG